MNAFISVLARIEAIDFDHVFQQVMLELGIQHVKSSAYHPFDPGGNLDESVHLLLFAIRESVQESLGFSPFELVFGHNVRGPLKLLKEKNFG